jgi:hypothetical protein
MSIETIDGLSQTESLPSRILDTIKWIGTTIAKIIAVSFGIFVHSNTIEILTRDLFAPGLMALTLGAGILKIAWDIFEYISHKTYFISQPIKSPIALPSQQLKAF